ncbi:SusC/RagA family TonB-linked outer membrane protein [Olivibacter sitiensis]|uniref:SusC/RagA family TonB-linked outer membrane protein n=1 Tax=Olivibacter sitiensis TaxID=376470 RepID=UPI0003F70C6E|nr:TonB-dependent receptor [Olivibacter sitiensis]
MNKIISYLIAGLLTMLSCLAYAQERQMLSGIVLDEEGKPFAGVTVQLSPQRATKTDDNGQFSIAAALQETLTVSFVGYTTYTSTVSAFTPLRIQLSPAVNQLADVVVYGYGTVNKRDLTGAIAKIDNSDLMQAQATNVSESLNGRVSGVLVTKSSNRPGADMSIQIRGINSFNYSNEPLYVIDGVPSYSGMRHLNAADIESIDILKDASSSAIYGSRGANGVVIITTKSANRKAGFQVEYNGLLSLKTPTRIPDMIGNMGNGLEYIDYKIALWTAKYGESSLGRSDFLTADEKRRVKYGEYYDWLREISGPSVSNMHHVTANGSSEKSSYSFGLGFNDDDGMVGKENFKRYTFNLGLEHRASDRFKIGMNSYLSLNNTNHGADDALINAYFIPPVASPYDAEGNYSFIVQPTSSKINPFVQVENNKKITEAQYVNMAGFMEFKPLDGLTLKSQLAMQLDNDLYGEWIGTYTQAKQGVNAPDAFRRESKNTNYVWDNTATYDKRFNEHHLNAVGLFSMQKETHKGSQMRGVGLPFESDWHAIESAEEITGVSSYYWESSMLSYMARLNYDYQGKYLFTATGRADGSSRLANQNRWGFMPSLALGWRLSEENFLKGGPFDDLKLRLSWGKSGNNNVSYDVVYSRLDLSKYSLGQSGTNGYGLGSVKGNKDLRWEMMSEWNAGLDFAILDSRLTGTLEAYDRTTKDLIFQQAVAGLNGYTAILRNIGSTGNRGLEASLNSTNITTSNFQWRSNATFSLNRNRIKELYGTGEDDLANRWFIGQPINVIYDYEFLGIWQEEEADEARKFGQSVGHIKVKDQNGDYVLDERDYQVLGTPSPSWTFGLTNTFNYKNWDLSVFVYGRIGGLYNDDFTYTFTAWDNEHWNKLDVNYWTPENRSNEYPEIGAQSYYTQVLGKIPGTFVKIQNVSLGYTLPAQLLSRLHGKNARFYATVINPFTFTSYKGPDPETIGESMYTQLSLYPMSFNLGINFTF